MSQKDIDDVKDILDDAVEEGIISQKALQIIDINDTVLDGINGMDVDDIQATDVTLLTVVIDNTGSIRFSGLTQAIRDGQNAMIAAIENSKQKDNFLIAQWKLGSSAELIHSYLPVDQAIRLNKSNYNPNDSTALYDVWVEVLASNVAYAQQLRSAGTAVKSVVVIITDGQDNMSVKYSTQDCNRLNSDLLRSEQFILAFIGAASDPGDETYFRMIAEEMAFPDGSVLTVDATPSEIRNVFSLVSQSAISASQKNINPNAQNSFFTP